MALYIKKLNYHTKRQINLKTNMLPSLSQVMQKKSEKLVSIV